MCFPQEEIVRYKKQYEDMLIERNKFKQQCTQVKFNGIFNFLSIYFNFEFVMNYRQFVSGIKHFEREMTTGMPWQKCNGSMKKLSRKSTKPWLSGSRRARISRD